MFVERPGCELWFRADGFTKGILRLLECTLLLVNVGQAFSGSIIGRLKIAGEFVVFSGFLVCACIYHSQAGQAYTITAGACSQGDLNTRKPRLMSP